MRDAIDAVESFVDGMDCATFLADARTSYAVRYALLVLSEASRRLPLDMRQRHPDIPWRNIADLGNLFRHEYHRVSDITVWRTVTEHLSALKAAILSEIAALS
jgi:uncharacterized protein with HEPN domain